MDYNMSTICYRISLWTMFLNILEDDGQIIRLWHELTMQTCHIKLLVGETVLPVPNSYNFKRLPLRLINHHREANFQEKLKYLWIQRLYCSDLRNMRYKHSFSLSNICSFNDHFYLKPKNSCQYKQLQIQNIQ